MSDAASGIVRLRAGLAAAETELARARGVAATCEAMIRYLRREIAKLRREQFGASAERRARLIDQLELQLEELEAAATGDEIAAGRTAGQAQPSRPLRAAGQPASPSGPPAARAGGGGGARPLRLLRLAAPREDGQGHDRDAGGGPAPLEGHPDPAGEAHPVAAARGSASLRPRCCCFAGQDRCAAGASLPDRGRRARRHLGRAGPVASRQPCPAAGAGCHLCRRSSPSSFRARPSAWSRGAPCRATGFNRHLSSHRSPRPEPPPPES